MNTLKFADSTETEIVVVRPDGTQVTSGDIAYLTKHGFMVKGDSVEPWMTVAEAFEFAAHGIRVERDKRLAVVLWRVDRYNRQLRLSEVPIDDLYSLDHYINDLANVPQQEGFPDSIIWPEIPSS